jgi:hypothetical protein
MNRFLWFASAALVFAMAVVAVLLGQSFLPSSEAMQKKLGTLAPLFITWGMIWMTAAMALALSGFLVVTGMKEGRSPR